LSLVTFLHKDSAKGLKFQILFGFLLAYLYLCSRITTNHNHDNNETSETNVCEAGDEDRRASAPHGAATGEPADAEGSKDECNL
jgi:hypothetical protein